LASGANWKSVDEGWSAVDELICTTLVQPDGVLTSCIDRCRKAGLPDIAVTPALGRFLQIMVAASGARRVLEIGTLGGFSTIFLARGLPEDGGIVSLEANPDYARVARENLSEAGLADRTEVLVGAALDTLRELEGPFDFFFIDADKVNNCNYFDHAVRLASPGALIVVDNVVREGRILEPEPGDEAAIWSRRLYDHVAACQDVEATVIQTVGEKGWDGMLVARFVGRS